MGEINKKETLIWHFLALLVALVIMVSIFIQAQQIKTPLEQCNEVGYKYVRRDLQNPKRFICETTNNSLVGLIYFNNTSS